ncbi:hypothetical protein Vadar_032068 [Vaccinium darrowii]|uniref:Uncharacterized protein n=1 Tax=Vaccinium darrowii TaxID=229202 RepID=A0ACB7XDV0_9ERIC|nr:hypothetical protein Vadar_032068 [Vaccinium darrowii]
MVTLQQLLRKSLLVSSHSNTQLRNSALILAHMIGNSSLVQKLSKLCSLEASNPTIIEENSSIVSSKSILVPQEADSLCEELEFVKNRHRMKSSVLKTREGFSGYSNRWIMTKSWNSCPIGMLPRDVGGSGRLPILDCDDDHKGVPTPIRSEEQRVLKEDACKRGPDCDVEILEKSKFKKMRENGKFLCVIDDDFLFPGRSVIDGKHHFASFFSGERVVNRLLGGGDFPWSFHNKGVAPLSNHWKAPRFKLKNEGIAGCCAFHWKAPRFPQTPFPTHNYKKIQS